MADDADLPRALVKRIAKAKLASLEKEKASAEGKENKEGRDIQISRDALLALSESARVFIHYLTATGNVLVSHIVHCNEDLLSESEIHVYSLSYMTSV